MDSLLEPPALAVGRFRALRQNFASCRHLCPHCLFATLVYVPLGTSTLISGEMTGILTVLRDDLRAASLDC